MSRKIIFVLPWVLTLALVVGISAQGKVTLTDAEMSSVYGGGRNCYTTSAKGCMAPLCYGDCTDCPGWVAVGCPDDPNEPNCKLLSSWTTGCLQSQRRCGGLSPSGSGGCSNRTATCTTPTTEGWQCGIKDNECECSYVGPYDCDPGSRLWCVET